MKYSIHQHRETPPSNIIYSCDVIEFKDFLLIFEGAPKASADNIIKSSIDKYLSAALLIIKSFSFSDNSTISSSVLPATKSPLSVSVKFYHNRFAKKSETCRARKFSDPFSRIHSREDGFTAI